MLSYCILEKDKNIYVFRKRFPYSADVKLMDSSLECVVECLSFVY